MDNNMLIIVAAVGLVLMIYVIRYIISRVLHKGADAIENKIRQARSEKHPAENQSLAERLGTSGQNPQSFQAQSSTPTDGFQQPSVIAPNDDRPISFCTKCGAAVKPGNTFCVKCGAELKKN